MMKTKEDVREWTEALESESGNSHGDPAAEDIAIAFRIVYGRELAAADEDPYSLICAAL